jgi:asparagine synthase (glutamine-hydrolysing)
VEPELRVDRRDELLQLQFTTGHKTPFAGIDRVLPGETIVVEKGRIVTRQRIEALPQQAVREMTRKQGLEELERHLVDSVVAHLRSDVPCGIFLSGGIDSAAIGATMARLGKDPIIAFTAHTSSRKSMDELVAARAIAKTIGAKHIEVECGEPDFWSILPKIVSCMDEPAAESSALLYYRLAATAREADIKVVLTGEGGDELFGGYSRYRRGLRPRILGGRPMWSKGIFEGLGVLRNALDWRDGISAAQAEISANEKTALQAMQLLECAHRLPNDLLATLDRCLMAFGVEGRTPFIDRHFAQFAYCLPDGLKVGRRAGKLLLKAWVEASMPSVRPLIVRHSADVPVAEWIAGRANDLGALVASQPGIVECCKSGKVQRLFSSAKSNRQAAKASWALLFYALWHHLHILRRKPSGDVFETLSASE